MTTVKSKLVSLLIVGAALAASPALAQAVTGGNKGPAEIPANRDAPLVLPGDLNAMPTPKVDEGTSRDLLGLDPALVLESLGTVTVDRNGDVSEAPASDAMRAAFEAQIKGSKGN